MSEHPKVNTVLLDLSCWHAQTGHTNLDKGVDEGTFVALLAALQVRLSRQYLDRPSVTCLILSVLYPLFSDLDSARIRYLGPMDSSPCSKSSQNRSTRSS